MKLTAEAKLFAGMILATILIVVAGIFFFSKPQRVYTREELLTSDSNTQGNKEAQDFLVEFSDFQCPACKTFKPIVDEVVEKNKDKLLFIYRHFPLPNHDFALKAAWAAEAAGRQGKFWEMADYLFANQERLADEIIAKGAIELKLDQETFKKDFESNSVKDKVQKDLSDGTRFGVDATPTFFLNGQKLNLINVSDLAAKVEEKLKK